MHTIVFTGGPCGGKTIALNIIAERLRENDFATLAVPETATELLLAGAGAQLKDMAWIDFQEYVMRLQIAKEEHFGRLLACFRNPRTVLLCDRGVMDGKAYMDTCQFETVKKKLEREGIVPCSRQYDAVFHLVTAADGAEKHYNLDNRARLETLEEAREKDGRIRDAWRGHWHHVMIDNRTDFEGKLERLWVAVCHSVGISGFSAS